MPNWYKGPVVEKVTVFITNVTVYIYTDNDILARVLKVDEV